MRGISIDNPERGVAFDYFEDRAAGCDVRELSRRLLDAFGSLNKFISSDWRDSEERIKKHNKDYPDRQILGVGRANRMSPEEMRRSSVITPDNGFILFRR